MPLSNEELALKIDKLEESFEKEKEARYRMDADMKVLVSNVASMSSTWKKDSEETHRCIREMANSIKEQEIKRKELEDGHDKKIREMEMKIREQENKESKDALNLIQWAKGKLKDKAFDIILILLGLGLFSYVSSGYTKNDKIIEQQQKIISSQKVEER